jgi:hypothetical protein
VRVIRLLEVLLHGGTHVGCSPRRASQRSARRRVKLPNWSPHARMAIPGGEAVM